MDDEQCFAALAAGGKGAEKAWGILYERHAKRMLATLRAWRLSPDDSADVVQEVFMKLARIQKSRTQVKNPRAYMATTLKHCFVDFLRSRRPEINESSTTSGDGEADDSIIDKQLGDGPIDDEIGFQDCLDRALKTFRAQNEEAAQTVYLSVVEQFSGQELAEVLGRSHGATREFLSQCKRKFEGLFREICPEYVPDQGGLV